MQFLQELKSISQLYRKRKKKHDKIVLLGKTKSDTIEVLISKALIDSYISPGEYVSVDSLSKEFNEMKKEIENP